MSVTVKMLVDKVKLDVIYGDDDLLSKEITTSDISRPGLEMTGYFDYYSPERLQLLGMKEWSYLTKMTSHNRRHVLREMIKPETPAIIVARNLAIPEEMISAAKEKGIAILQSHVPTSRLSGEMSWYLDSCLAERTSVHGVLMDIYGMGVLIQGDSGIGKSETGLELVKRGHRLVADDRVVQVLLRIHHKFNWPFTLKIMSQEKSLTVLEMVMKSLSCQESKFHVYVSQFKLAEICQLSLRQLP